ncbi:MAG TPA: RNA-binding S4 domain-containing protein [Chthoniobacter sp.]|jgi:ribosome-associated heat shock protein Hsp15
MRLDQWLWAVRVYKSRSVATDAIRGGRVKVNGVAVKPAYDPKLADLIVARVGIMVRTVRYIAAPKSRVSAKLVPEFAEDLTPPEEWKKRPEPNLLPPGFRPKGAGRPTKKDRRAIVDFGEEETGL